jgi:membrane associated rhomboid family serine protease
MEARMGRIGFLAFYLVGGVCASLIHIASDPTSVAPMLGASGAISAVLGGYLLLWPKAKIRALVLPAFLVTISAYWFLIVWFGMQLVPVLFAAGASAGLFNVGPSVVTAGGGVAYWAHIGGFIAGFIGAGVIKLIWPNTDVCYIPTDCDNDDTVEKKK